MNLLLRLLICTSLLLSFYGCASLGTKTRLSSPETVARVRTVAVWPIAIRATEQFPTEKLDIPADGLSMTPNDVYDQADRLSRTAERELLLDLQNAQLFQLIDPDAVTAIVKQQDSGFVRWSETSWQTYRSFIDADAFLLASVKFAGESDGYNTYVTLVLYDKAAETPALSAAFNTKWGKSYFNTQPVRVTLPDAMKGVVNALANAVRRAQDNSR